RIEVFPQGEHSDLFNHGAWRKVQTFLASLGAEWHPQRIIQELKMTMTRREAVSIFVDEGRRVSGLLQVPSAARVCYVLAHGAGAGMSHPFMEAVAAGLAEHHIA